MKKVSIISSFDLDDQQLIYDRLSKLDPKETSIVLPSNKRPNERNIIMMAESLGLPTIIDNEEFRSNPDKLEIVADAPKRLGR